MLPLRQDELEEVERDLFAFRETHFKATARVDISRLVFENSFKRQMDKHENLKRLLRIMDTQGCQRFMKDCHVPVLVPLEDWEHRVRLRRVEGFLDWLDVDIDYQLRAQDHENLITAARKKLSPTNQWWIVDVYVTEQTASEEDGTDSPQEKFVRSLRERFPNDRRPPDGLIYERIRRYEGYLDGPMNRLAANNWWAVLETVSGSKKAKYLQAFFKHTKLPSKLDNLLAIQGIWEGMRIGLLHKLMAMRCDEAIICYWDLILKTFLHIVGGEHDLLRLVDGVTVGHLQSRAPKVSRRDLESLERAMTDRIIFREIHGDEPRREIWERLKNIDYPIPTLETFFKDRLYLEVARSVMRQLFVPDPNRKVTVDEGVCEQYDTNIPMLIPLRQEMLRADLWELWRFSFQYGFEMTEHQRRVPRAKMDIEQQSSHQTQTLNSLDKPTLWQHFYSLAAQRGFRTPVSPEYSAQPIEQLPTVVACDSPDDDESEIPLKRRAGKPFADSVEADRFALSAESLRQPWVTPRVTAGFLRRSVFYAFFRYLAEAPSNSLSSGNNFPGSIEPPSEMIMGGIQQASPFSTTAQAPAASAESSHVATHHIPPYATQQLPLNSQPNILNELQPTVFMMDVSLDGSTEALSLPNDPHSLNQFFRGLSGNYFHISNPDENGKGMSPDECYSHYNRNPLSRLHATFLAEEQFLQRDTSSAESARRKRKRMEGTAELNQARQWLQDTVAALTGSRSLSQHRDGLTGDEMVEEL